MLDNQTLINDLIHELGRYPTESEVESERKSRIDVLEAAADYEDYVRGVQLNWNGDY